ncbi:MAG: zf-TFIIB domain-containing protein [Planctomycetota bacterium]
MDCPRCHLGMTPSEYEGHDVHFCPTCWGFWLTRPQLESIIAGGDYHFSRAEAKAVQDSHWLGDVDRQGDESAMIACPVCGATMNKHQFAPNAPVEVDECPEHGVWLDTGEIKDLQVMLEGRN